MFGYIIVGLIFVGAVVLGPVAAYVSEGATAGFKATVFAVLVGYVAFGAWVVSVVL